MKQRACPQQSRSRSRRAPETANLVVVGWRPTARPPSSRALPHWLQLLALSFSCCPAGVSSGWGRVSMGDRDSGKIAFWERQGFDRQLSRVRWSRRTLIATSRGPRLVSPIARRGDRRGDRGECAQPIANPGGQAARGIECIRQDPRGVTPWRVATPRRPALWWADRARGRGRQSDRLSSMYLSSIPARSK